MISAHVICGDKVIGKQTMAHAPRVGDILRMPGEKYYRVKEVVWCMDEEIRVGPDRQSRVNLGVEVAP